MKYLASIVIAVGITGVIILGVKLSGETLGLLAAAAIGIIGGVCGAVPVSVVLVWALIRRTQPIQKTQAPQPQYPPVIVIGGNGQPMSLSGATPPPFQSLPSPERDFRVVPDDEWKEE